MLGDRFYSYISLSDVGSWGIVSDEEYYDTDLTRDDVGEIYCVYLRKSREDREIEQYENVDTLDRHEKNLLGYAEKNKLRIGHIYREVVSGDTIAERPEMQNMIRDIENLKWTGCLVVEVYRLARGDGIDQGTVARVFKVSSTKIRTLNKVYNPNNFSDEEYFEFELFMSRREYKAITRRLQAGRMTSVLEGKYLGSVPPFGYKRKKIENNKGYTLEPEQLEAEVVKQIFNIFAYQENSINGVVREVNYLGLKPRKSLEWSVSSIKDILKNPVYIGKIRWNARKQNVSTKFGKIVKNRPRNVDVIIVDGLHTPIIDKEIWNIVQSKIKRNNPIIAHNRIVQNPLAGLIYCEKCGKLMQRRPYIDKPKEAILICNNKECDNVSSKLSLVEDKIIEALRIWMNNYYIDYNELLKMKNNFKISNNKDILFQLEKNLIKEEEKQKRIYDCFEEGFYNKEEFVDRLSNSKEIIKNLENRIKILQEKVQMEKSLENEKGEKKFKIKNVMDIYDKLQTSEEKNIFLKAIIEKVTYLKTKKAIKKESDINEFEINIYPKIR